jgi:hypothetical protein
MDKEEDYTVYDLLVMGNARRVQIILHDLYLSLF